jgi:hypothetical protein
VERIVGAFRAAKELGQRIALYRAQLEAFGGRVASTFQQISNAVSEMMQLLVAGMQAFDQYLKALSLTHERFGTVMFTLGWPPPNDYPISLKNQVIEYYDANGPVATKLWVEAELLKFYNAERLRGLIDQWNEKPLLDKRIEIVRAAVEAHCDGKYVLSIPALLPQIEGLIADGFVHQGEMHKPQYKKHISDLMDPDAALDYPSEINNFVTLQLLARFEHGGAISSDLSRHAILHGGDTTYGTEVKSLKAILLFHSVQDAFRLIITSNGKCYHLVGCSHVMKPGQKREYISSVFEPKLRDKRPCKYCMNELTARHILISSVNAKAVKHGMRMSQLETAMETPDTSG